MLEIVVLLKVAPGPPGSPWLSVGVGHLAGVALEAEPRLRLIDIEDTLFSLDSSIYP